MCGRFTLVTLADIPSYFPWIKGPDVIHPRYNIAPTQPILIVPNEDLGGQFKFTFALWGLIPSWAKDPVIGHRMINARAETLAEKPTFRTALRRRRCLIPADGFYEWRRNADGSRTPMYIRMKSRQPFMFAGLWDDWCDRDASPICSATIITTGPNELMKPIHDRMPAILSKNAQATWVDPRERDAEEVTPMLAPYPAEEMEAFAVSTAVNNPKHDASDCVAASAAPVKPAQPRLLDP